LRFFYLKKGFFSTIRPKSSCRRLLGLIILGIDMNNKEAFIKKLGQNVREKRLQRKLTVEKLSMEAGMPYSQISRLELGKRNPTAYTLYLISNCLECNPSEFFEGMYGNRNNTEQQYDGIQ
jgi:DNA-binding Xre family transcriptional regulator